ncbi:Uncharacterised protein g5621 [Pycnogonum litorale]
MAKSSALSNDESDEVASQMCRQFQSLTPDYQTSTLQRIMDVCSPEQLHFVCNHVKILSRDFLRLLPLEITYKILRFLAPETLLVCCQVSRRWNDAITGFNSFWMNACDRIGINCRLERKLSVSWKRSYVIQKHNLNRLERFEGFESQTIQEHRSKVTALCLTEDDDVIVGFNDRVIEIIRDGLVAKVIRCENTVSCLACDGDTLVASFFMGTASSWNIKTGHHLRDYRQHSSSIFTIDLNAGLDLVVSGGADSTAKLWSLSEGRLHQSLTTNVGLWVVKVVILPEYTGSTRGTATLLTIDQSSAILWSLERSDDRLSANRISSIEMKRDFFTPGFHFLEGCLYYATQDPLADDDDERRLHKWDVRKDRVDVVLTFQHRIKILLGVGERFVAYLTPDDPFEDSRFDGANLYIVDLADGRIIGRFKEISSRPTTPECSQMAFGDRSWLDGMTTQPCRRKILLAQSYLENNVSVTRWSL